MTLPLMQGQMPLGPARDGLFPAAFGTLSERGTPTFGLVVSSGLCTVLVASNYTRGLLGLFEFALLLATVTVVVAYACAAAAHVVLIVRRPERWAGRGSKRAMVAHPEPIGRVAVAIRLSAGSGGAKDGGTPQGARSLGGGSVGLEGVPGPNAGVGARTGTSRAPSRDSR